MAALKEGVVNLLRHVENLQQFGVPVVVGLNRFTGDTDAEVQVILNACAAAGAEAIECTHWAEGGAGAETLAKAVVAQIDSGKADYKPLYPEDMKLWEKIETIATKIYRAGSVTTTPAVKNQLKAYEDAGYGKFPVCMAKTPLSFSTDPTAYGAPEGHEVNIREVRLSAGAGFIVAICGSVMTMPGLPRVPAANSITVNDAGEIEGLF